MLYCKRIKGVMLSLDFRMGFETLVRIQCKQWDCPCCRQRNEARWRAHLLEVLNKRLPGKQWCFLTITANPKLHKWSPEITIRNLQEVWKKLYDRLLRRYGKESMEYVRVFEPHKSGKFHMHILLACGEMYDKAEFVIRSKKDEFKHPECLWLSATCAELGGGWRVHITRVHEHRTGRSNAGLVTGYILKYMGKNFGGFPFPKHQRRICTSRRIGSPATASKGQGVWIYKREISKDYVRLAQKPILDMTTGEILTERSFEDEFYYPPLEYYRGEAYLT